MTLAQESKNCVDGLGIGDQRENSHLSAAVPADQRVFTVDLVDQVGPAPTPGLAGDPI
jgi:hypothetical protein